MKITLNTSIKRHLIIAGIISTWLVLFLVIFAPFDVADLSISIRLMLMPLYGVISFVGYLIVLPFQNAYFKRFGKWGWKEETGFITLYSLIVFIGSFAYYKTDMINGTYSLAKFAFEVYTPIFLLLLSTIVFLRWIIFRAQGKKEIPKLNLRGDNKHDMLQIPLSDLVSVSSADNYVEIHYLNENILHKKLLRTTLKTISNEVPELLKVHRSHLINPSHIISWKETHRLELTQLEVPVSKQYKKAVAARINRP